MSLYLWIALGSGLGGVARFALNGVISSRVGETFPWGTFAINIIGCFVIGLFATTASPDGRFLAGPTARHFVMTGILGGFTTFSSFSLQTLNLARDGEWFRAGAYAVGSLVLCLVAVWLGHIGALAVNGPIKTH